mmetsp:Transcript_32924/g.55183  ORF Transcript_32924/g.55183 Transcript_32924/m.55183 type:complete len:98 (-) Transcript_32924:294-587(-)
MACAEIVDAQNVALLPSAICHILVNCSTNLVHFLKGNWRPISERRIEGHFVSKEAILDKSEERNQDKVKNKMDIFDAREAMPELHRKSGPVEYLNRR